MQSKGCLLLGGADASGERSGQPGLEHGKASSSSVSSRSSKDTGDLGEEEYEDKDFDAWRELAEGFVQLHWHWFNESLPAIPQDLCRREHRPRLWLAASYLSSADGTSKIVRGPSSGGSVGEAGLGSSMPKKNLLKILPPVLGPSSMMDKCHSPPPLVSSSPPESRGPSSVSSAVGSKNAGSGCSVLLLGSTAIVWS